MNAKTSRYVTAWIVVLCVGTVALGGIVAVATPISQAQERPTVSVSNATVDVGNQTAVDLNLSSAPNGVAGYSILLEVDGSDNATIENVTFPEQFDLSTVENQTDSRATLRAVDLDGSIADGQENVALASVQLAGQSAGNATVSATVDRFDDPDGEPIDPQTSAGTVQVLADDTELNE
jgi:hypothetical protein